MTVNANINRLIDKPDSSVKAVASVTLDNFYAVHGVKVCEGEKGLFVSMPSTSYTNTNGEKKYQDVFHPITKGARDAINEAVIRAYNSAIAQANEAAIEVKEDPDEDEAEQQDMEDPGPMYSM